MITDGSTVCARCLTGRQLASTILCPPPASPPGLVSTQDPALIREVGVALGQETRAESVAVLLSPGINMKRFPLCGHNFE